MIRLRGHHLLCSLTFTGRGYSDDFERDFKQVIARLKNNETIEIVSGPDDICASIQRCTDSHCHEAGVSNRDKKALEDVASHLGKPLKVGSIISPDQLFDEEYRSAFKQKHLRRACNDCQWSGMCDQIAEANFATSLLLR